MKTLTIPVCIICFLTLSIYAQNDDLRIQPSTDYHQTENSITIDPTNSDNLIATFIGSPLSGGIKTPYFYSHDGGITWEGSDDSPNGVSTLGDPFVIFNNWGDAFFISKGNPGINFFKSTDKGENWTTKPKLTADAEGDKPHVNVGVSESNKDHVYAVWTHAEADNFKVYFRRSTNRGESFGSTKTIYSSFDNEGLGAYVVASPNGDVYIAFVKLAKSIGTQMSILIYKSTDGGQTFLQNPAVEFPLQGMGSPNSPNNYFNGTRVNSFPFMAVDNSGTVYLVYTNNTALDGGNIHIYLRKSSNWSNIIEVHSGQGIRQWFSSIAIDKTDSKIYVSYYNMITGSPNFNSYRNIAVSTNGGVSFTIEQISDVSFVPDDIGVPGYSSSYMGDYFEIAALDGIAFPCWSDNRSGIFQAYISPVGGAEIILDQKLTNNTTIDKIDRWGDLEFKELDIPKLYHFKPDVDQILRGDQEIISNEKFNKWNVDYNVLNHRVFSFETSQDPRQLTSQFAQPYSMLTIKNKLLEVNNIDAGKLKFRDPWFINYNDPTNYQDQYGFKNLGSGAIYEWVNSPFNPKISPGTGSEYKGVFLNQTIISGRPYYSINSAPNDIELTQTGKTHKFYWQSWEYDPAKVFIESPSNSSTNVVFLSTDNNFITANLKGTKLSDNTEAYNNNSQRKFVRTDNGNLHNVYISMGALWYERSTDGGTTWEIVNSGKPVNTNNPKQPSIDYLRPSSGDEVIVIAYQQQTSTGSQVLIDVYKNGLPRAGVYRYEVISFSHSASEYGNMNAEPVIALADQWDFLIVYKVPGLLPLEVSAPTTSGLYYSFGWLNGLIGWEVTWWSPSNKWVLIPTTGLNSVHPSLDDDIYSSYNYFHIAYEENNQIKYYYRYGQPRTGSLVQTGNPYSISSGNGFTQNYRPSIIGMGTTARVCWVGSRISYAEKDLEIDAVPQYKVLFKCPTNPGSFWQFGSNVSSPNINNQNDNTYYAFGWSENLSQLKFADNTLSTVRTLSDVTGQNIQISNGTNKNNMYAMAFEHNTGVPFYFEKSNNIGSFYSLAKITNAYFSSGREGIVSVNSAAFYFALGDVIIDGVPINFKEMPDTIVINNLNSLNEYLITEPFNLSDNSSFIYSVQFGLNDSLSAVQAIVENKFINFKLLLIDNSTNEVIGEYDNIAFNSTNLFQYNNIAYQVNTQGIGNRTVKMKLLVDVNFDAGYSLSQIYSNSEEGVLGKSKIKQINFNDGEIITTYELSQNYPNPFNPITIIKYQIPQDGIVTLKIFDIIGEEVATLVNEEKLAGKYEVNFNASSFASGVYIYKIQSGAFVSSKKMILLK